MPRYVYQSLETGEEFVFFHAMADPAMTRHPETGESIERIITGAPAVHLKGLKKHVRVNHRSPAATACGCASNAALAQQMFSGSRPTPRYGSTESRRTILGDVRSSNGSVHEHRGGNSSHRH